MEVDLKVIVRISVLADLFSLTQCFRKILTLMKQRNTHWSVLATVVKIFGTDLSLMGE